MLDQSFAPVFGDQTIDLAPGIHDFVVERFGGGAFQFNVSREGTVTSVSNAPAAAPSQSPPGLRLNTKTVRVDPGQYGILGGVYELDTHRHEYLIDGTPINWLSEPKNYELIPDLVFVFSNGVRYAVDGHAGWFTFLVNKEGGVDLDPESEVMANGGPNGLTLKTACVQITSSDPHPFHVGASDKVYQVFDKLKIPVIPGLLSCIRWNEGYIGFFTPIPGTSEHGIVSVGPAKYNWKLVDCAPIPSTSPTPHP